MKKTVYSLHIQLNESLQTVHSYKMKTLAVVSQEYLPCLRSTHCPRILAVLTEQHRVIFPSVAELPVLFFPSHRVPI